MSATAHHANVQARVALDYYATPDWCVRALLAACPVFADAATVLDPSCGSGNILNEMKWCSMKVGMDIDPLRIAEAKRVTPWSRQLFVRDAMSKTPWPASDVIVMNPPYSLAFEFVQRAVATKRPTAALLRLAFMGTNGRRLWQRANPSDVYVLSKRPSFRWSYTCKGKKSGCAWTAYVAPGTKIPLCPACGKQTKLVTTDASEYAWFVWGDTSPLRMVLRGRWAVL